MAERSYFFLCLGLGRLLRAGKYSTTRIVAGGGALQVRKRRLFYAPLLVWMGGLLVKILDTGMRVLPQREWEERERRMYEILHGHSIRIADDETLVLPHLAGKTLASLLEDPSLEKPVRRKAVELAAVALTQLHHLGFTHGDAMAENVLIDLDAGAAHWFDFETVHDEPRPIPWRRSDDVRALLSTCLLRTDPGDRVEILQLILDAFAHERVMPLLAASFSVVMQRPLAFHLGQAPLSFHAYREIGRILKSTHWNGARSPAVSS